MSDAKVFCPRCGYAKPVVKEIGIAAYHITCPNCHAYSVVHAGQVPRKGAQ
jgi:transposase-like protein